MAGVRTGQGQGQDGVFAGWICWICWICWMCGICARLSWNSVVLSWGIIPRCLSVVALAVESFIPVRDRRLQLTHRSPTKDPFPFRSLISSLEVRFPNSFFFWLFFFVSLCPSIISHQPFLANKCKKLRVSPNRAYDSLCFCGFAGLPSNREKRYLEKHSTFFSLGVGGGKVQCFFSPSCSNRHSTFPAVQCSWGS
jgi:hypothetical protein